MEKISAVIAAAGLGTRLKNYKGNTSTKVLIDINNQGSTVLMATHDYDMISNFPKKTLRLEDGKLFELSKKT